MVKQRGNPNWGKPAWSGALTPTMTEFEQAVRKFKLEPNEYVNSKHLRKWVEQNLHSKYIPESLLKAWGLGVQITLERLD
jgi:intergrase/recombinase